MTLDKIFQKREEAAASLAQVSYSLEEGGWGGWRTRNTGTGR